MRRADKYNNVGKIGWCPAKALGLSKGHYVYIRDVKNDKAKVNTFTSLEDNKGKFKYNKIVKIREGVIYPIPKKDTNLFVFSGLYDNYKTVPINSIYRIGEKRINRKYLVYINKFLK